MQTDCRFSLSVMCDNYAEQILGALGQVNLDQIWSQTDALSTTYRGKRIHVIDALQAVFIHVNDAETHVTMEATFSKSDFNTVDITSNQSLRNAISKHFDVRGKFAFYPLVVANYENYVNHIVDLAEQHGLYQGALPFGAELFGDVQALFAYFNEVLAYADAQLDQYALQITLSINSPTKSR